MHAATLGGVFPVLAALGLILAIVIAWIFGRYRRDMRTARNRVAQTAEIAKTPCGDIEYADVGKGPPALVIHGAGGGFDQGLDFAEPLIGSGFRVISMSRFGYLRTPFPGDASPEAQARAHACLLDALGIRQVAVLGGSAGTTSAVQFALLYPDRTRHLVLVVPAMYVPRERGEPAVTMPSGLRLLFNTVLKSDFLFWAAIRAVPRIILRTALATPPKLLDDASAEERARVAQIMEHVMPISRRRLGLLNDELVTSTLERYDLERISVPTLIVSAADDLFGTYDVARYTAQHIPGARLVSYATGGHLLVGRNREEADEVVRFLQVSP